MSKVNRFFLDDTAREAVRDHTTLLDTDLATDRDVIISIGRNLGRRYLDSCIDSRSPRTVHGCDGYVGDNVAEFGLPLSIAEYDMLCDYARREAELTVDA
jgi:hypothetical protein